MMFIVRPVAAQEEGNVLKPLAPMGIYTRAETMFDGVLEQELVGFLKMNNNDTLLLPVLSTGKVDTPLNFSISLWFKAYDYVGTTADDYQIIFAFQNSVRCYITSKERVMCDSASRAVLEVVSPVITSGQWINLLLACREDGSSTLVLHTDERFVGEDHITNFPFT